MATSRELSPRVRAELNEWVKTDNVEQEKAALTENFLLSSSLVNLVAQIVFKEIKVKEGFRKIHEDQEYLELWKPKDPAYTNEKERRWLKSSRKAYTDFLVFGGPGAVAAASNWFREYIVQVRKYAEPGPAFKTVLDYLPNIDQKGLEFIARNRTILCVLDEQYFAVFHRGEFKDRAKEKIANKAKDVAEAMLNDALDSQTEPKWREFLIEHFPLVVLYTSMTLVPWKNMEAYDPIKVYRSLKSIFASIPNSENFPPVMDLILRLRGIFPHLVGRIGKEVQAGNLRAVKDVYDFIVKSSKDGSSLFSVGQKYWLDKFWSREISFEQLNSASQKLEKIEEKIATLKTDGKNILAKALEAYANSDLLLTHDFSFILEHAIYPTPMVIAFLKEKGPQGVDALLELRVETNEGRLDLNNLLQKELEYINFLEINEMGTYEDFLRLPVREGSGVPILTETDMREAKATAFEAARVYWIIRESTDQRRKVVVIGNNRYGKLFVLDPLRSELELLQDLELLDGMSWSYVRSGGGDELNKGRVFDDGILMRLATETPDIAIIDGTKGNYQERDGRVIPRFSRAMFNYVKWVKEFNEGKFGINPIRPYAVTFRSFIESDKGIFGNELVSSEDDPKKPRIVVINSTIDPSILSLVPSYLDGHKPGFFDDPEEQTDGTPRIVWTESGLKKVTGNRDLQEYIMAVQEEIAKHVFEMVMLKDTQLPLRSKTK